MAFFGVVFTELGRGMQAPIDAYDELVRKNKAIDAVNLAAEELENSLNPLHEQEKED